MWTALPELMQVAGMMSSSAVAPQKLENPQMTFGSVLAPLQSLIEFLTAFGLPFPFAVAITNAKFSVKTSAQYEDPGMFEAVAEAISQGLGVMLEIELEVGLGNFDDNPEDAVFGSLGAAPVNGGWTMFLKLSSKALGKVFDPLPVFLGGASKFEIESSSNGASKVSYGLGIAGVAVVKIPEVISLKGSRTYLTVLQREVDESGAAKVGVGVSSEWEVEGELAEGLAGVKLSFELLILVEKTDDYHARGQGTLAIDVTAAYVLHKSFEVEFDLDERIVAAGFVAGTVLL